jgi:cobalamin biosynthesis protein CobD/CbiB
MNILKMGLTIFFNLPLIISVISIVVFLVSYIRGDFDLRKLIPGVIGLLAVIVTSLLLGWLPRSGSEIGYAITYWIARVFLLVISLSIITKTYEEDYKTVGYFFITAIALFILFNIGERIQAFY